MCGCELVVLCNSNSSYIHSIILQTLVQECKRYYILEVLLSICTMKCPFHQKKSSFSSEHTRSGSRTRYVEASSIMHRGCKRDSYRRLFPCKRALRGSIPRIHIKFIDEYMYVQYMPNKTRSANRKKQLENKRKSRRRKQKSAMCDKYTSKKSSLTPTSTMFNKKYG